MLARFRVIWIARMFSDDLEGHAPSWPLSGLVIGAD